MLNALKNLFISIYSNVRSNHLGRVLHQRFPSLPQRPLRQSRQGRTWSTDLKMKKAFLLLCEVVWLISPNRKLKWNWWHSIAFASLYTWCACIQTSAHKLSDWTFPRTSLLFDQENEAFSLIGFFYHSFILREFTFFRGKKIRERRSKLWRNLSDVMKSQFSNLDKIQVTWCHFSAS